MMRMPFLLFAIVFTLLLALVVISIVHEVPTMDLKKQIDYSFETARNISVACDYSDGYTDIVVTFEDEEEKYGDFYTNCSVQVNASELFRYSTIFQRVKKLTNYDISIENISMFGVRFKNYRSKFSDTTISLYMLQVSLPDIEPIYVFYLSVPDRVRVLFP